MKVTLEEMQAFVVVADSGSFTAAADQLGQTTSGISRALSRLENKLGVSLLHRTTRRLVLSEEGQLFLVHARGVIQAVEHAEEQLALSREQPCGRLRINAATTFMQHVIVPLIPEFRRRYPHIVLELNTDDVFIDLLEQHTDIAIRIGVLRDSTIHAAIGAGVPVVPICISNTHNKVKLNRWNNGLVIVEMLPPVDCSAYGKDQVRELAAHCHDVMAEKIQQLDAEVAAREAAKKR